MRPQEGGAGGGFQGITAEPHQLDVAIDNVTVWTVTLGGPELARGRGGDPDAAGDYAREDRNKKILEMLKFSAPVKAGSHLVQAYFAAKTSAYLEDLFDQSLRRDPYRAGGGEPKISSLTITGPSARKRRCRANRASRTRVPCTCASGAVGGEDEEAAARRRSSRRSRAARIVVL